MKHWLERVPKTTGDYLRLALGIAVIFGVVWQLPAIAGGVKKVLDILSPFAWGVVLAYVLDIPARFFAQKLFGGKRGLAVVLSYILLFSVVGPAVPGGAPAGPEHQFLCEQPEHL